MWVAPNLKILYYPFIIYKFFTIFFFICSLRLNVFLALIPKVQCSKFFRFLEFFGKCNGKKWSQIWKLLLIKGVKLPRKNVCFLANFALLAGFGIRDMVLLFASVERRFVYCRLDFIILIWTYLNSPDEWINRITISNTLGYKCRNLWHMPMPKTTLWLTHLLCRTSATLIYVTTTLQPMH